MIKELNTYIDKMSICHTQASIVTVIVLSVIALVLYFVYTDLFIVIGLYILILAFPLLFLYVTLRSLNNGLKSYLILRTLKKASVSV